MSKRPWMPFYVGDFIADTMHLSATETGIYMRLILHCWQHGTIPRDDRQLALISHCDTRLWHQYSKTVLGFFDAVDASTMHHKRVSAELHRCEEISNKRSASAKQKHINSSAKQEQLHTHSHSHSQREEDKDIVQIQNLNDGEEKGKSRKKNEIDPHFIEFYCSYPRRQSKQDALKAYSQVIKTGVSHETIMTGLDRAKRDDRRFREAQFTPLPASWLRAGGFEDESGTPDWKKAVFS